jgi:8-oxo-dGTP pyrophosphatase MutT (NUDIX family)
VGPPGPLHRDALALLSRWPAPDAEQERLRLAYVDHLRRHPDGLSRTCRPHHLTASTLVVSADHTRVLLSLHAKAGAWFQLGGHCEDADRTLAGAARREAVEESGISDLVLYPPPLQLDTHDVAFCGQNSDVRHLDVRFLAVAPAGAAPVVSAESTEVAWWPVDGLPTEEASLHRLVHLARRALGRLAPRDP